MANTTKFRIEMENNSDARRADVLNGLGLSCKHNGGKTVIAIVPESKVQAVKDSLEANYRVKSYTWEE